MSENKENKEKEINEEDFFFRKKQNKQLCIESDRHPFELQLIGNLNGEPISRTIYKAIMDFLFNNYEEIMASNILTSKQEKIMKTLHNYEDKIRAQINWIDDQKYGEEGGVRL